MTTVLMEFTRKEKKIVQKNVIHYRGFAFVLNWMENRFLFYTRENSSTVQLGRCLIDNFRAEI